MNVVSSKYILFLPNLTFMPATSLNSNKTPMNGTQSIAELDKILCMQSQF